ncbi:MAG TPA: methionyl-tRNA formyltransferase [Acidimicrobiales bacterium]|nr:methionyl-tRNA formyltransferase [Acidimicrobiales bacterium]
MPEIPPSPRRLAFLGTPDVAAGTLRALVAAGFDVPIVITRADKRRSRGGAGEASPVKVAALDLGIPVTSKVDDVLDAGVDLGVVVAFGQLIKPHVLDVVPMVNVHFSLLPRWRGAAPVERAILAGDAETGVCIMRLEEGLDTGPVFVCERVPIGPRATTDSLRRELADVGTRLLLDQLRGGVSTPIPQSGEPTYAAKIESSDLEIDWRRSAGEVDRVVRAGRAWTTFRGARLLVLDGEPVAAPSGSGDPGALTGIDVATGNGAFTLITVQPEGRRAIVASSWVNGARVAPGELLGS